MAERYLQNLDAWCWRYRGNPRAYEGAHFTAKQEACEALLRCLEALESEGSGSRRTIPLRALRPEDEAKITGGLPFRCFDTLRVQLLERSDDLQQMSVGWKEKRLLVHLTDLGLPEFRDGVTDVRSGTGDYAIGPEHDARGGLFLGSLDKQSAILWFWPCFGHIRPVP